MAPAPKLMRRVKGVLGAVRAEVASSSSTAFSSMISELVEILPLRRLKGVLELGEVPVLVDSPKVEMDRRRRWSLMAVGKAAAVVAVDPFRWKRLVSGLLTELRRCRDMSAVGGLLELSVDILTDAGQGLLDIWLACWKKLVGVGAQRGRRWNGMFSGRMGRVYVRWYDSNVARR